MFRLLTATALIALCANPLDAQDAADSPPKNWTADIRASAKAVKVFADAESSDPLKMVAAYQWANVARRLKGERSLLLYLQNGRPVASCKVYPNGQALVHTFVSMTGDPIEARRKDRGVVWTPRFEAPTPFRVRDSEKPSKSAAIRRLQMKKIAARFSATTGAGEAKRQKASRELRLLPTPLLRYPKGHVNTDGVVDGAVFCFVIQGGNPQVLMVLEAVERENESFWQATFSRRTFAELEVSYKARPIWNVEFIQDRELLDPRSFFFKLVIPVRPAEETPPDSDQPILTLAGERQILPSY